MVLMVLQASLGWNVPAAAQDAPHAAELRPLATQVGAMMAADHRKSIRSEAGVPANNAPVLNPIAPEARSLAISERRGAIDQMLQTHEFSFGGGTALGSKDVGRATGVDLDRVKIRVSRGSVMLKAQFTFN